jgi:hypothetical protein
MDSNENQLVITLKKKIETIVSMLERSEEERLRLHREKSSCLNRSGSGQQPMKNSNVSTKP